MPLVQIVKSLTIGEEEFKIKLKIKN